MHPAVLYSVLVSCLVSTPVLGVQNEDREPMFELHCEGLYNWPVSEIDQEVMDAFMLLKDRLAGLVQELDLEPYQGQAMLAGWDLFTAGTAIRFDANEDGLSASLVFEPGDAQLESLYTQITGFAGMAGLEINELSSTNAQVMGPMGPIGIAFDDDLLWLSMGEGDRVSMDIAHGDLPKGIVPAMSGRMDIGGLVNLFAPDLANTIAQDPAMAFNPMMAFIGPDAPVIEFGVGFGNDQMHMTSRMIDAKLNSQALGMTTGIFFDKNDFKRVPKDAVRVTAIQTSISTVLSMFEAAMEEIGSDEYAEFTEELGVDLIQDILGNMGDKMMYYQSESTGGGGLLSAVLLVDLKNAQGFHNAHGTLINRLNELARSEADGYIRVQNWQASGIDSFTFTTPGLPIPFEPSWAINENTLILALSPSGLEGAISQIQQGSSQSVVNNRSFKESILARMPDGKAYSVSYYDADRLAKKGYGMTSLLTSALANAVRSPSHHDRVVGSLMPSYSEFIEGIESSSTVSWWDGDDFRTHYIGDDSMLVQISTGLGSVADVQGVIVPALAGGVLLPALGKARERANELEASTQVRIIVQGMIVYSGSNNDRFPESLEKLIDEGFIEAELLQSPFGPAFDGGGDFAIRSDDAARDNLFNARFIIAVDRAMWVNWEDVVAVGFADAHVEMLTRYELQELLDLPLNEGAAEILDLPDF